MLQIATTLKDCMKKTGPYSNVLPVTNKYLPQQRACGTTLQSSHPAAAANITSMPHFAQSITPAVVALARSLQPRSAARPRECYLGPSAGNTAGTLRPRCAAPAPPSPGRRPAPPGTDSAASCGHGTHARSADCAPAWLACHPACCRRCCCCYARLPPPRKTPQSCPSCAGPAFLRDSPPPHARCKLVTDRCRRRA